MKAQLVLGLFAVGAVFVTPARAGGDVPFDFSFTAAGGNLQDDGDSVAFFAFPLTMAPHTPSIDEIVALDLTITGLSHTGPANLNIFLINPFGTFIEIMTDRGDGTTVENLTMMFSDAGDDFPTDPDAALTAGPFKPDGLQNVRDEGFATFAGVSGGAPAAWTLIVIDDRGIPDVSGSFESFTLRGTAVPEPVTLSLLALGALVTLRRRRTR